MMLVAIVRAPARADDAAAAFADAAALTLAEARMRLAPEPPALLARLDEGGAASLVLALRKAGLAALAVPLQVPTDRERTVARAVTMTSATVRFDPRAGDPLEVPWSDVVAILRGSRSSRSEITRTEHVVRFSVTKAVTTGGLSMTRTGSQTSRSGREDTEQVILVYARDGRAAVVRESDADFSSLGAEMQPSSTANMATLAGRLRAHARGAFYDERLLRLGRRPVPFLARGESSEHRAGMTQTRVDTSGTLDVLAEVIRRAVAASLLP